MSYAKYRFDCERNDVPPLTKREWENEGKPTFKQSNRISHRYQEKKWDEETRRSGWV